MEFNGPFITFPEIGDEFGILIGFGTKKGDSIDTLKRYLGLKELKAVYVNQVHGKNILFIDGKGDDRIYQKDADAIVTDRSGIALCIFTADCLPVVLINPQHGVIGIIHCGWRGLKSGIVQNVIETTSERWKTDVKDFKVYLGPSIRGCCYEVGNDVYEQFPEGIEKVLSFKKKNSRWVFNIAKYTTEILRRYGITDIHDVGLCSSCRNDLFNSRRFHGSGVLPQLNFVLRKG